MTDNELYAEATKNLREYMGQEPYYMHIVEYVRNPDFRSRVISELVKRVFMPETIKGLWK